MTIAQHSSATNEAYTPALIVEPSRQVLGTIDLDPASCAVAQDLVQAATWYDASRDGMRQHWQGRVFLNPPGGLYALSQGKQVSTDAKKGYPQGDLVSSAAAWWTRLVWEYMHGQVTAAIFVCFSMSLLRNVQNPKLKCIAHPLDFPVCIPRERVNYDKLIDRIPGDKSQGQMRASTTGAPADSMIVYLPDRTRPIASLSLFESEFEHLGKVLQHG